MGLIHSVQYGDYRLDAVEILRQLWNASGQFVTTTTVELVTVTLTLTMIDQPEIRQIGMDMYTSLLDRCASARTTGAPIIECLCVSVSLPWSATFCG